MNPKETKGSSWVTWVTAISAVVSILGVGLAYFQYFQKEDGLDSSRPIMLPSEQSEFDQKKGKFVDPTKKTEKERQDDLIIVALGYSKGGQSRYAARLAAETDAKRKLAEKIHGALIESETNTNNGELQKDRVTIRVNALLSGATKVSEIEKPDGGFEVEFEVILPQGNKD